MSAAREALPLPDIYYDSQIKDYFIENNSGLFIRVNETSVKRHLKMQGFSIAIDSTQGVSPLEKCIADIQMSHDVSYAASLAGYNAGLYTINGRRILVTDTPHLIQPVAGGWPLLTSIFDGMFNDPQHDQRPYVFGWLKITLTALRTHQWQPGQVLAMAGPVRSAKSLFQKIVTAITGGRVAHPYQYMTGATTFNADLFAAEHLAIEDAAEHIDIRKRRHFGAQIKEFSVNHDHHCHGKNKTPLNLTPTWRVTISLNDDPERLLVLPPIDSDIEDKIMLLKVNRREMPMPTDTPAQIKAFWTALVAELPAFVHYLENYEIPAGLRSPRFGVVHYHHPDLLEALSALAPEQQLLEMIDRKVFYLKQEAWTGSALGLHSILTDDLSSIKKQAIALLPSVTTCGTYMSRLAKEMPLRVTSRRVQGHTQYTIQPPERTENSGL